MPNPAALHTAIVQSLYEVIRQSWHRTHCHFLGATRFGKSKAAESVLREHVLNGGGFCLIDPHGPTYRDLVKFLAYIRPWHQRVILVNPSIPERVIGFDPTAIPATDPMIRANRCVDSITKVFGMASTNEAPRLERVTRSLTYAAHVTKMPLPVSALLLRQPERALRRYVLGQLQDSYTKAQWEEMDLIKSAREWREVTESTNNRLARFVSATSVKRFMAVREPFLDVRALMDENAIVLVNLARSDYLDQVSGLVFAAMLLAEFFDAALKRASDTAKPRVYPVFCDEFQSYLTPDTASLLDQVLKGGLHLMLAHQHLGHLEENPALLESVLTNAKLRAVFGGLSMRSARIMAEEMFLGNINRRDIKETYFHTVTRHKEQKRTVVSGGASHSVAKQWSKAEGKSVSDDGDERKFKTKSVTEGGSEGDTEQSGWSDVPFLAPYYELEKTSDAEWSRDEKVSRSAQLLIHQQPQECWVQAFDTIASFRVETLEDYGGDPGNYIERVTAAEGMKTGREADQCLTDAEAEARRRAADSPKEFVKRRKRTLTKSEGDLP